jgi:hypothetical protein
MNLFAGDSSLVYLDWHHMIPDGNRKVAAALLPLLLADARRSQPATAPGPGAVDKTTLPTSNRPGSGPPSRP